MTSIVLVSDDPIYVDEKLGLDPYIFRDLVVVQNQTELITEYMTMSAGEARDRGFKVDPSKSDSDQVEVSRQETLNTPVQIYERRLVYRKKSKRTEESLPRTGRSQIHRAEIYDASIRPLYHVNDKNLSTFIKEEIHHWKTHDIGKSDPDPLVVVFLDCRDDQTHGYSITTRKVFLIREYSDYELVVEDSNQNRLTLAFTPEAWETKLLRRFTLFFPSNAVALKEDGYQLF